jgi:hypothetical protein
MLNKKELVMTTKTFVRLQKLVDVTYDGETAEATARWLRNVNVSGVEDGYTYADDESGSWDAADFACDEMEFADVVVYDFMGSAQEDERFYERDIVTFKNKLDGKYYVLYEEDLGVF